MDGYESMHFLEGLFDIGDRKRRKHGGSWEQNSAINAGRQLRQKQTVPVAARSCLSLQPFAEIAGTNVDERHIFKDRAIRSNT
jgi:hypothetical protein